MLQLAYISNAQTRDWNKDLYWLTLGYSPSPQLWVNSCQNEGECCFLCFSFVHVIFQINPYCLCIYESLWACYSIQACSGNTRIRHCSFYDGDNWSCKLNIYWDKSVRNLNCTIPLHMMQKTGLTYTPLKVKLYKKKNQEINVELGKNYCTTSIWTCLDPLRPCLLSWVFSICPWGWYLFDPWRSNMPVSYSSCPLQIFWPLPSTCWSQSRSTSATQQEHVITQLSAAVTAMLRCKKKPKIEKSACMVLSSAAGMIWHLRVAHWLQSINFLKARSDQIHVILSTSMFAERLSSSGLIFPQYTWM